MNEDEIVPAYTKTKLMVVDCSTKPVNGAQLALQVSYLIGQRFFPTADLQHFHDLDLASYAWNKSVKRLHNPK